MDRRTSCYCNVCLIGDQLCDGWQEQFVKRGVPANHPTETAGEVVCLGQLIEINQFVCAVYKNDWYVSKVCEIDIDDNEVEISFMEVRKMYINGLADQITYG